MIGLTVIVPRVFGCQCGCEDRDPIRITPARHDAQPAYMYGILPQSLQKSVPATGQSFPNYLD